MHRDTRRLDLLVIEDNMGDYVLVEEFVNDHFSNCTLHHLQSARGAESFIEDKKDNLDLVLLDLTLPDKSGEQLIQDILDIAVDLPVVVLTGYTDLSFSVKSLKMGVSDYLLKDDLTSSLLYKSITYAIERNAYSQIVKESEKNYKDLFELSPEPLMLFDLDSYEFLDVNIAAINNYGYSKEEFLSMTVMDIKSENEKKSTQKLIQSTKDAVNMTLKGEHRHIKKNGEIITVEITASSLLYKGRNARVALIRDVTEKRKEEERLKLLESVITNTTEAVVIMEAEPSAKQWRRVLYVNEGFTKLTGYKAEDIVGKSAGLLNGPGTDQAKINLLKRALEKWEVCEVEFINYKKDGTPFWIHTTMVPVKEKPGLYSHWVAIGRDITDQREYEKDLKESLQEKEVLLAEIHHRVKNNLAVVSGMMQLQVYEEDSEMVEAKLNDSISRIHTMATIHEILYQSGSFSKLSFSEILKKLIESISSSMAQDKHVDVQFSLIPLELNINQAIPCSLIINEVITNVYKHAFKGRKDGVLEIELVKSGDQILLRIKDNGVGLPDDFFNQDSNSLGKHLIKILSIQLGATYNFKSENNGTEFDLTFKKANIGGSGNASLLL